MSEEETRPAPEAEKTEQQDQAAQARPGPARETSGEYLWRVLKPAGAVAVLLLFILFLVICFTTKGDHPVNAAAPAFFAAFG